ncbi:MAG: flavodoxin family protein [Candidatus Jordarchaeales archaeon]|nr:flavodoxin family protein [Candidatus Jordarchaeia archaeon]
MNILAIVGSPHKKWGCTYRLTKRMLDECQSLGAETEIVLLQDYEINYCRGCGLCLVEGECPQKDDVKLIQGKMMEADGIVMASPVYVFHVTGLMKNFIDRCLPMGHRPSLHGKYAAAISVYLGVGDVEAVARYMLTFLMAQGAYPVGIVAALARNIIDVSEEDLEKAANLGREMVQAIKEKRTFSWENYVAKSKEFQALRKLILEGKDFFKKDYEYWKEKGWL